MTKREKLTKRRNTRRSFDKVKLSREKKQMLREQRYYYALIFSAFCPFYKFKKFDVNFIKFYLIQIAKTKQGANEKFLELVNMINCA